MLAVPITVSGDVTTGDYTLNAPTSPPAGLTYALSGNSPRITFNGTNGAPRKASFTVSAVGDFDDEGQRESIMVGLGAPTSNGSGLAGGTSRSGTASFHITDDDGTPVIGIAGGNRVTEGGRAVFTLNASPAPQQDLTVNLNVEDDATADFIAAGNQGGKTVQILANASSATYGVQTVNDSNVDEPRGAVSVTVTSGTAYTASSTAGSDTVEVTDDDPTTVTLSTPDAVATEGSAGDKASIRLALPRALVSGESLKAALNFSGGSIDTAFSLSEPGSRPAGVSYDLTANPPTVAFTGGPGAANAATVEVAALADKDETDATITVSLGTITGMGLDGGAGSTRSGNGRIRLADIGAEPAVDIDMTTLSLSEGGTGNYRVKLHADPGGTVTVTPDSSDDARLSVPGALTFTGGNGGNWSQWRTVTVESLPDADLANDNIKVAHAVSGYGSITKGPEVDVSIVDAGAGIGVDPATLSLSEGANTSYRIKLLSRPSANVTVTPASGDAMTATAGAAVTFAPSDWNTAKTVQVNGIDNGMTRIAHTVASADGAYAAITPAPVDVTVTATARVRTSATRITAIEHGPRATYDVWLNTDPGGTVTVTPGTTSSAITLSGALTFTSGNYGMKQQVTVTANPDLNATSESAAVTHAVSGYPGVSQGPQVAVAVQDAGSDIIVSAGSLEVREGGSVTYDLTTTTQVQGATFVLISGQGSRVTVNPTQVQFNAGGSRTQTVTVQGASAGFTTLTHTVSTTDPSYRGLSVPGVGVLVTPQHGVIVNPVALTVKEGGAATYNVRLASDPNATVTVTPVSRDTGAARVSGALTFNSSTWQTNQTVTVTGVPDGNGQHESVVIAHQVAGYAQVSGAPDLTLRVEDDEARPFVGVLPLSTALDPVEGQPARFEIRPNAEILSDLTVQYAVSATGGYVAGSELVTKTVTVPADPGVVSIDVPTLADNIDKASGSVTATIVAGAGYQVFEPADATRPVFDNDRGSAALSVPAGNIDEAGGGKTLTITLNRALEANENLSLRLAFDGDASPGTDFALAAPDTPPAGVSYALDGDEPTVTFRGPSAAAATVILTATDDSRDEGSGESVSVKLAEVRAADNNLGGGMAVSGTGAFTIVDDDEQMLPEVAIAPTSSNAVTEGGNASFTLTLDPAPEAAIEVNVTVTDAANSDFLAAGNQGARKISVDANATTKVFTVPTEADSDDEASGPIRARVTGGDDYEPGTANAAEARIIDNDASRVTLATPDASAMEGDASDTASISLTLNRGLANGEALIVPLGFAGGAPAVDFTLACPTPLPTGVSCAGLGGASPSVGFTGPGAGLTATGVTLSLTVIDDLDTDHERVTVSIPAATGGNPRLTASGLDGGVSGVRSGNGEIVLTDKDTPPQPTVNLSVSDSGAVTEGGNLTLTAAVSEAPSGGSLSIPVQRVAADSTADGDDYTLAANITIANGATSGTATLTARADNDDELAETLRLQLGAPPEGYVNGENSAVDITVTDNTATAVTLTTPDTQATEGDGTDTAEIRLGIGRGMVDGERLTVPLQFSGAALGTDFSLALSGTPTGVTLDAATGEVTFAGPSESATEASILLTAAVDNNAADATVTVSIPASSTGSAPVLGATNLDGGATGSRGGNGRITLKDAGLNVRTIGWASATLDATETASAGSVNVRLTSAGASAVTFRVCLTDGTAAFGSDYAGVITAGNRCTGAGGNADFTIAAGATTQTVNFASIADATDEPDETYTAVISLPTPVAGLGISPDTLNVSIGDDDPTTVSLARSGSGAIYEGAKAEFTVTLGRPLVAGEIIDAPLAVSGNGITTGDWSLARKPGAGNTGVTLHDAGTATPRLRFAGAGARVATLELTATADGVTESGGETLTFALGPDGAGSNGFDRAGLGTNVGGGADPHAADNSVSLTVNDGRTIGWAATAVTVNESAGTVNLNAELSEGAGPVTFRVCLNDGGATLGEDFSGVSRASARCTGSGGGNADPTISSGASSRQVSPGIDRRVLDEPRETFEATLSLPNPIAGLAVDSANATATVTIVDKDPTLVTLSAPEGNIAEAGGIKRMTLSLGRALVSPEALTVPLNFGGVAGRGSEYTVACESAAGVQCASLNSGNAQVTFNGGANAARSVDLTVTAIEDNVDEGPESVTVSLGALNAGSGANLDGGASGSGSVRFDVAEEATIGFASATFEAGEGDGDFYATVRLSEPVEGRVTATVALEYLGTAGYGDYRATGPFTVRIPAGETTGRAGPVTLLQDTESEGDETLYFRLTKAGSAATGQPVTIDRAEAVLVVRDDDPAVAGLSLSKITLNLTEGGAPGSYTAALTKAPDSDVTMTVTSSDANAVRVHTGQGAPAGSLTLTFSPRNWNQARTIVATAQQDADHHDERPHITHDLSGTGDYHRRLLKALNVELTDDDDPPAEPVVSISGGNGVTEGGTARFTLRASPRPRSPIDVSVNIDDSGDFADPGQTGAKTVTIGTGGSFTLDVTTYDDSQVESDGAITAALVGGSGYTVDFQSDRASVAVSDNDEPPPPPPPPDTPVVSITGGGAVTEGGTATFNLSASPPPASAITVNIDVADSGDFADSGQAGRRTVTINTGGSSTLTVTTDDDNTDESHGSLTATVATGQGYSPSGAQGTASIAVNDNDLPPPTPVIGIAGGATVTEGGNARFTLTASPAPRNSIGVSVTVSQTGDFAAGGQIRTRTVNVGSGGTASFTVATDNDSQDEPHGAIDATVNDGADYDVDSQNGSASVTVEDNDEPLPLIRISRDAASVGEGQPASFTVSANPAPTANLDVRLDVSQNGDFAQAGQTGARTVTIPANTASVTHSVTTVDDEADEANGSISARIVPRSGYRVASAPLNRATIAVTDDDVPTPVVRLTSDHPERETAFEGAELKFSLRTDVAPETDLDVTVAVSQPGNAFVDAGQTGNRTVTILANTRRKSFTVGTRDDSVEENPSHAAVTATVRSGTGYTVANAPRHEASVDVHDNDGLPIADIRDVETEEGEELVTVIELSKPVAHEVEACYRVEIGTYQGRRWGTATHPNDFVYTDQCLTIRPGQTRVEGWIETVDDNIDEGDEWFTLVLYRAEGGVIGRGEAIATIRNSDPLPDAWLARFGRAVSEQALEGVTARMEAARAGGREPGFQGNIAGRSIAGNRRRQAEDCPEPTGFSLAHSTDLQVEPETPGSKAEPPADPGACGKADRPAMESGGNLVPGAAPGFANLAGPVPGPGPTLLAPAGGTSFMQAGNGNPAAFGPTGGQGVPGQVHGPGAGPPMAGPGHAPRVSGGMGGMGQQTTYGGAPDMLLRQLLSGSHFTYDRDADEKGGILGFWGRGAVSSFSGAEDTLRIDGDMSGAMLGADYLRGDWLFGLALNQSLAEGGWSSPDKGSGTIESTLSAAIPYAAWEASERLSLWGAAGRGGGAMTLNPGASRNDRAMGFPPLMPAASPISPISPIGPRDETFPARPLESLRADIHWTMASLGLRGDVLAPAGGGPRLAVISDALWTRTTSDRGEGMLAGAADVSRLRLGLEGSWTLHLGGGDIRPKLEAGLRHDGGDAETGFGLEVGGGFAWRMPSLGLSLDIEGRALLLHEAEGRGDQGFSATMNWDPGPESRLGPKFSLRHDLGGQATGGLDALFSTNPVAERMGMAGESRWTTEAGWGMTGFAKRFLISPTLGYGFSATGRDYSFGWALEPLNEDAPDLSIGLRFNRRESAMMEPQHTLGLELRASW